MIYITIRCHYVNLLTPEYPLEFNPAKAGARYEEGDHEASVKRLFSLQKRHFREYDDQGSCYLKPIGYCTEKDWDKGYYDGICKISLTAETKAFLKTNCKSFRNDMPIYVRYNVVEPHTENDPRRYVTPAQWNRPAIAKSLAGLLLMLN